MHPDLHLGQQNTSPTSLASLSTIINLHSILGDLAEFLFIYRIAWEYSACTSCDHAEPCHLFRAVLADKTDIIELFETDWQAAWAAVAKQFVSVCCKGGGMASSAATRVIIFLPRYATIIRFDSFQFGNAGLASRHWPLTYWKVKRSILSSIKSCKRSQN